MVGAAALPASSSSLPASLAASRAGSPAKPAESKRQPLAELAGSADTTSALHAPGDSKRSSGGGVDEAQVAEVERLRQELAAKEAKLLEASSSAAVAAGEIDLASSVGEPAPAAAPREKEPRPPFGELASLRYARSC